MKRFFPGLLALSLAVGAVAFKEVRDASRANLFWYVRTGLNTYREDTTPNIARTSPTSVSCDTGPVICAKGFTSSLSASTIKDTTTATEQQMQLH